MKTCVLSLLILSSLRGYSQNLVPNPSFEDTLSCPMYGMVSEAVQWSACGVQNNSPDYFHSCVYSPWFLPGLGVPDNVFGFQYAATGSAYCGFYSYYPNDYREYIIAPLTSPMVVEQTYYVCFKVSYARNFGTAYSTDKIGAQFTMGACPDTVYPNNFAHVYTNTIITDTLGWTVISGSFVADSAYQYIRLGNFFDNANTNSTNVPDTDSWAYYYIDDIYVSTTPSACLTAIGTNGNAHAAIDIFPNPTEGPTVLQINKPIQNATLSVVNVIGESVYEMQNVSDQEIAIDLHFLTPGLYFLRLVENREVLVTEKLVIQN
jgi:hypothetical protein